MSENKDDIGFSHLSTESKKEILQNLVVSLLGGLNKEEQKEILHAAITTGEKNREVIQMVGH